MIRLRRAACTALLVTLLAPLGFGLSRSDFDRLVDFSITMKAVAAAAAGKGTLPRDRLVLLDATVQEITLLDADAASFHARVTLMAGEWIGLEQVAGYSCYVDFTGPNWADAFPAKPPRNPPPGVVVTRARVLVVAQPLQVVVTPLGEKLYLLAGMALRVIR